jgi:hypothetical protein
MPLEFHWNGDHKEKYQKEDLEKKWFDMVENDLKSLGFEY